MALVEIEAVTFAELDSGLLHGRSIDLPHQGSRTSGRSIDVAGWVIGRSSPAVAVELLNSGKVIRRLRVDHLRPDVAAAFPQLTGAAQSGFHDRVRLPGFAGGALELRVVLADQQRVPLGTIRARRSWSEAAIDTPLVSVIIPCYKQAHFLGDAIESVLAQTYPHSEIVVVDDGSPDNTEAVATRYPAVRYTRQDNQGLAAARNTGLRRSNGDFLVFLDADDRLLPAALETGLQCFHAHPECALVAGHFRLIGFDGQPWPTPLVFPPEQDSYLALLRINFIGNPATVLYRRSVFQAVTGFDPSIDATADYDLYLRVARDFPIHYHGQVVADYRKHGANMSADMAVMLASVRKVRGRHWRVVRKSAAGRTAYRDGTRNWQHGCWGEKLVDQVRASVHQGEWGRVLRELLVLGRCYPRGIARLLAPSLIAAPPSSPERIDGRAPTDGTSQTTRWHAA
jgi:glycosyltransferase involved in cell wall biosynthesis